MIKEKSLTLEDLDKIWDAQVRQMLFNAVLSFVHSIEAYHVSFIHVNM